MKRLLFATTFIAIASTAGAQQMRCGERDAIVERLQTRYSEAQKATGMVHGPAKRLIEIWSNEEAGSFTVLLTTADGKACVAATGKHWSVQAPEAPSDDT